MWVVRLFGRWVGGRRQQHRGGHAGCPRRLPGVLSQHPLVPCAAPCRCRLCWRAPAACWPTWSASWRRRVGGAGRWIVWAALVVSRPWWKSSGHRWACSAAGGRPAFRTCPPSPTAGHCVVCVAEGAGQVRPAAARPCGGRAGRCRCRCSVAADQPPARRRRRCRCEGGDGATAAALRSRRHTLSWAQRRGVQAPPLPHRLSPPATRLSPAVLSPAFPRLLLPRPRLPLPPCPSPPCLARLQEQIDCPAAQPADPTSRPKLKDVGAWLKRERALRCHGGATARACCPAACTRGCPAPHSCLPHPPSSSLFPRTQAGSRSTLRMQTSSTLSPRA